MNTRAVRDDVGAWRPASAESRQLAQWLRRARLTIVLGDDRAELTSLLAVGLLPLLGRRAIDALPDQPGALAHGVLRFPERRQRRDAHRTEVLVLLDAAREPSAGMLETRFDVSARAAGLRPGFAHNGLAGRIEALATQQATTFLFVIDGAEALLTADAAGSADLVGALLGVLSAPLPANVLLAVCAESRAAVASFTRRLPGVEPEWLELPRARPPLPELPVPRRVVEPEADAEPDAEPARPPTPVDSGEPRARVSRRKPWLPVSIAAALIAGAFGWYATGWQQEALPDMTTRAARTPAPTGAGVPVPATAAPPFELVVEGESGRASRAATELAAAIGPGGEAAVRVRTAASVIARLVAPEADARQVGIVRYDVLRAAPAGARLVLVAPLFTESLHAVVRADSRRRYLHELRGARINAGPATGGRAVSAGTLYAAMFGASLPPGAAVDLPAADALRQLLDGEQLDAVLLVGAEAGERFAALAPQERRALRVLALAPEHPASRKALQTYLPVSATGPSGEPVAGLAALDFLVTTEAVEQARPALLGALANALCGRLPSLQRDGDPKWREVQGGLRLPVSMRNVRESSAAAAWEQCSGALTTPVAPEAIR